MTLRAAKLALIFGLALYYSLVVLNNITDYNSDYQFVRHVLMMDTTYPGNHAMWRAIDSPVGHTLFYLSIIVWEAVTMALFWWGGWRLAAELRGSAGAFHQAKRVAFAALTVSLLMWLVAFLCVGSEWFLMWQSKSWDGREEAFRMFTVVGIVLLFVTRPEEEGQP